jgi:hypothetical protein
VGSRDGKTEGIDVGNLDSTRVERAEGLDDGIAVVIEVGRQVGVEVEDRFVGKREGIFDFDEKVGRKVGIVVGL